jgi:hypothetical protein
MGYCRDDAEPALITEEEMDETGKQVEVKVVTEEKVEEPEELDVDERMDRETDSGGRRTGRNYPGPGRSGHFLRGIGDGREATGRGPGCQQVAAGPMCAERIKNCILSAKRSRCSRQD